MNQKKKARNKMTDEELMAVRKPRCFTCGHELIWNGSHQPSEEDRPDEDKGVVINYYSCPHCGTNFEQRSCPEYEERDYPFYKHR